MYTKFEIYLSRKSFENCVPETIELPFDSCMNFLSLAVPARFTSSSSSSSSFQTESVSVVVTEST